MKTKLTKRNYKAMYRLLDKVSPVDYDCGSLCGALCCGTEDDCCFEDDMEMGIYLLPGEEKVHSKKDDWLKWTEELAEDYDFPDSWFGKIYFVKCKTPPHCPREKRPIQCRTFPLAPHIDVEGKLRLIETIDELPYSCPLVSQQMELTPAFIKATYTVWKHLIREPLIYDLVKMDSEYRDEEELEYVIIK